MTHSNIGETDDHISEHSRGLGSPLCDTGTGKAACKLLHFGKQILTNLRCFEIVQLKNATLMLVCIRAVKLCGLSISTHLPQLLSLTHLV